MERDTPWPTSLLFPEEAHRPRLPRACRLHSGLGRPVRVSGAESSPGFRGAGGGENQGVSASSETSPYLVPSEGHGGPLKTRTPGPSSRDSNLGKTRRSCFLSGASQVLLITSLETADPDPGFCIPCQLGRHGARLGLRPSEVRGRRGIDLLALPAPLVHVDPRWALGHLEMCTVLVGPPGTLGPHSRPTWSGPKGPERLYVDTRLP